MSNVLSDKDVNQAVAARDEHPAGDKVKSMEYHRQVLQSKMESDESRTQYVSPSDNIMSPCTAKLTALRNKHAGKAKPKSLFAQGVARKFDASKNAAAGRDTASGSPF
ncbi:related to BNS1 protein [Cephalotrichum gorgonifer]|uniref:Related to BNS1 protein n=1 Tax=Cephalotrichum gorgonifer TaxID=2041049 RepID=A0AAE8MSI9_9PEZI|nr:related to BNS1 protein [Cephalotrichum gorgonifer]